MFSPRYGLLPASLVVVTTLAGVPLLGLTPAKAVTWNFATDSLHQSNTSPGVTDTFTSGTTSITATGFSDFNSIVSDVNHETKLYLKNLSGDEKGLGLKDDPSKDNEISGKNVIQINTSSLKTNGFSNFKIEMGSSTGNEAWKVYGSNSPISKISMGTVVATGTNDNLTSLGLTLFSYYYIVATKGNILLNSFEADLSGGGTQRNTPLPAALPLMGTVLAGAWFASWRRRRTVS